jgi:lysophospholipase L1-like esterase
MFVAALTLSTLAAQNPAPPPATDCQETAAAITRLLANDARLRDWPLLARYRDANEKLAAPRAGESRVVFMGDSITDIWQQERFGFFVATRPYVDRGISGQTTPQMLVRFRPDVLDLQPKVVVILAGTNDIAGNSGPMTLEETEANFTSMAELARLHNIRVIFSSVLPVHHYTARSDATFPLRPPEKIAELNRWLRSYCAANGHTYLDYVPATADDKGWLKRELAEDGLHPGPAGYALMAALAQAAIEKTLGMAPVAK